MYLPLTLFGVNSVIRAMARGPIKPTINPNNPLIIISTMILGEKAVKTIIIHVDPADQIKGYFLPSLSAIYPVIKEPKRNPAKNTDA